MAAKNGIKIVIGLVPLFLLAAFIESFFTRYTQMPTFLSATVLTLSFAFVVWYFIIYPQIINRKQINGTT
jgi:ABC-type Na+ efflux pump permease subunit